MDSSKPPSSPVRYFAFGSNLWLEQMSLRCPSSPLTGIGRLRGYKWHINARGYANIAPTTATSTSSSNPKPSSNPSETTANSDDYANEVWGLVYDLNPADEAQLDLNEGVPYAYEKRAIPVEFWPRHTINTHPQSEPSTNPTLPGVHGPDGPDGKGDGKRDGKGKGDGQKVEMLTYIDFKRNQGGHAPRAEYVHRMNMGIRDALREGVPRGYVERVLRGYIPAPPEEEEEDDEGGDSETVGLALKQARGFCDESGVIPAGAGVVVGRE